jgi:LysR family cyn operon transcriptional activator
MLSRPVRYLLAVVDHGSFTRAAVALHVSQPAVSQQVRELEQRLGVLLLDRSGRTIRATDSGEAYIRHARRALSELEAARRVVRDVEDLSIGSLRIGFTPSFAAYLIAPLIERFYTRFPGISLTLAEMAQEQIELALAADELDVGIAFGDVEGKEIEWTPLHCERLTLVVGPQHELSGTTELVPAAGLANYPLALLGSTFATRQTVDSFFSANRVVPRIALEANSIASIVGIVQRSKLATILPEAVACEQFGLCFIRLAPAFRGRQVALLQRRGGYQSAACRAFTVLLLDYTRHQSFISQG